MERCDVILYLSSEMQPVKVSNVITWDFVEHQGKGWIMVKTLLTYRYFDASDVLRLIIEEHGV